MMLPSQPMQVHHEASVRGSIGSLEMRFEARFRASWTVIFGPSGCGKSTVLRGLCGLAEELHVRFVRTDAEGKLAVLQDGRAGVPTARRKLGYAPQHAGLFPHLSVEENVAFGARVRARGSGQRARVEEALELLRLGDLGHRYPRELSGGERQRVSLARALAVPDTHLLLLDEPFAGIDRALRDQLLSGIRQWARHYALPVISVTHDVDEVFLLAAEVVRLQEGRMLAQGPPEDVLADEAERVRTALNYRA